HGSVGQVGSKRQAVRLMVRVWYSDILAIVAITTDTLAKLTAKPTNGQNQGHKHTKFFVGKSTMFIPKKARGSPTLTPTAATTLRITPTSAVRLAARRSSTSFALELSFITSL